MERFKKINKARKNYKKMEQRRSSFFTSFISSYRNGNRDYETGIIDSTCYIIIQIQ